LIRLFNCPQRWSKKPWNVSMNTCEPNSLSGISISLRGGSRRRR
jgi:hypothetical protein